MPVTPLVSVLMPVYNAEKYLKESIESILSQSFTDFEFIVIDDASTDQSLAIIQSYQDERIRLFKNSIRLGIAGTLNNGIQLAKGKYIARMDGDDISTPERLEKQYLFLEANSEIGLCGCQISNFEHTISGSNYSLDHSELWCDMLFFLPIAHPSVMLRKNLIERNQLFYDSSMELVEDYDFIRRLVKCTNIANLPDFLLFHRLHIEQYSKSMAATQEEKRRQIQKDMLKELGIIASKDELNLHSKIAREHTFTKIHDYKKIDAWLKKIYYSNEKINIYPIHAFNRLLKKLWLKHFAGKTHLGLRFGFLFTQSPLSPYPDFTYWQKIKFWVKCIGRLS